MHMNKKNIIQLIVIQILINFIDTLKTQTTNCFFIDYDVFTLF